MIENNPYYRKFRQPKNVKKSKQEIRAVIENLKQRLGNEEEMLQTWIPKINKPLEPIDLFIMMSEKLLKEFSVLHICLLAEATFSRINEEIKFWQQQEYLAL